MAQPTIKTSFASGEWAPKLLGRVDIQKYHSGAALLRNFFVDWAGGGASTRQGTQFIAQTGGSGARLICFQPSQNVTYVLEFGDRYLRFHANGAQIQTSPGVPYQIDSPYSASDLFQNAVTGNPGIKFVQDVTSMIICHPSYPPYILTIISPTNWTLSQISFGTTIPPPSGGALSSSLPALASGWNYGYTVTSVDQNGQESAPPTLGYLFNLADIRSTPGTNALSWSAVDGAVSYNVYKTSPIFNAAVSLTAPVGFIGNTTGLSFQDPTPGIAPDFSQSPPILQNPFVGGSVAALGLTTTANYTVVPSVTIAPPASGITATGLAALGATTLALVNGGVIHTTTGIAPSGQILGYPGGVQVRIQNSAPLGGSNWQVTAIAFWNFGSLTGAGTAVPANPVAAISINAATSSLTTPPTINFTWQVIAVTLLTGGTGYTSPPAVTFAPAGATAVATLGPVSAGNPGVPGFIQQRLVLAGQQQAPQGFQMSQPGLFFNFNVSFPSQDDDAISGEIVSEDLNAIRSLVDVPTGILALTNKSGFLLNGGGGISTMTPMTPANITAIPQSYHGANDIQPLKVNMDILYVTAKGQYVRDLTYNLYAQIFTGADLTTFSTHLFQGVTLVDWCWCEEPHKTVWAVRSDGVLLSLAYIKDQELVGWAHHDTDGQFKSCCVVTETIANGETVDAVYVIVRRLINDIEVDYVERIQDRFFDYGYEDSWSVDCALRTAPTNSFPNNKLFVHGDWTVIGGAVSLFDLSGPFNGGYVGRVIRSGGGIFQVTTFSSPTILQATVIRVPTIVFSPYNTLDTEAIGWTAWTPVSSVSGLTQLANRQVVGVGDGTPISGTVDNSGNLSLGGTYTKVTVGLPFTPQLKTLPLDLGEPTVQSKRKKLPAVTLRVADTLGLQVGTSFSNLVTMKDFQLNAIPSQSNGPIVVTDLVNQPSSTTFIDGYQKLDQVWQEVGQLCVQQDLPYPATIIAIIPEVTVGDSK